MNIAKIFLTAGFAAMVALSGCGNSSNKGQSDQGLPLEKFTNDKNAQKQYFFLRIVEENETDSSKVYVAKSVFDQDTVGMKVEVLKNIEPGVDGQGRPKESGFVKGAIKISSIGEESNALVRALSTIFGMESAGQMSSEAILPTVFSSNTVAVDLSKNATYSFKLFFENSVGDPAEVFATLDLYKKSFEMSEKDASFRPQWLAAFEGK
ncbi:hypothetical protein [Sphingobacterium thermophilum]|uniref:Lipoprotein n=1 Tax=Sphingobacterium thermophilum TaxID=768534 RepID=A0ABP8QXJ5_9SPHI